MRLFKLALITAAAACALTLPPPRRTSAHQEKDRRPGVAVIPAAADAPPARPTPGTVVRTPSGIELVYVPPGSFRMGSTRGHPDEKPVHKVSIREGFYMGKYEVTQAQWRAVMGATAARQRDKGNSSWNMAGEGDDYPVYYVSWDEAQEFIHRLNARDDGFAYRLPSEAEWEYACRAGTRDVYAVLPLNSTGWWVDNSGRRSHPVGQKLPNAFGLYDMHGNVWEWCQDVYRESYKGAPKDGSAWLGGKSLYRVMRGGSWDYDGRHLRSANRDSLLPHVRGNHIGFRVVAVARR